MEENYDTLLNVEKLFTDYIHNNTYPKFSQHINFCCNEEDEQQIILIGNILKRLPIYSELSFSDIYIVLVYIFYGLRLTEEYDAITLNCLKDKTFNKHIALKLYLDITSNDIMVNNVNLSSKIRRYILGVTGGKNKKNRTTKKLRRRKNI
jgi:hypothetical protein